MSNEIFYRVKAGSDICDNDPPSSGMVRPVLAVFGRKLRITVAVDPRYSKLFDPATNNRLDACSNEYLEPWVDGEKWDGFDWVPADRNRAQCTTLGKAYRDAEPVAQDVTLRDRFAMVALRFFLEDTFDEWTSAEVAKEAYTMADAMVAARDARDARHG